MTTVRPTSSWAHPLLGALLLLEAVAADAQSSASVVLTVQ